RLLMRPLARSWLSHLPPEEPPSVIRDFRFALRQLTKNRGFTAVAVLTLAVAIGVNSAMFSLVNGVMLRPIIPVRPEEVGRVYTAPKAVSRDYRAFSYPEFR